MHNHHDARYPFLYVQTTEEERIIRENRPRFDEEVDFFSWDIAAGYQALVQNGGDTWVWHPFEIPGFVPKGGGAITDPKMALEAVRALPFKHDANDQPIGPMIFMKDFHKFFEKISISRTTLNLKPDMRLQGKSICFLSAETRIPPELANDITEYKYPYPDEETLMQILLKAKKDNGVETTENDDTIVNAMRGMTWEAADNALALSLVMKGYFDVKMILNQKAAQHKAGGVMEYSKFPQIMSDLYGMEVAKDLVLSTIMDPECSGYIFYGVPGCGKSHFIKALANEVGWPCLSMNFAALRGKYQGDAETRLRDSFGSIRAYGNVIVSADELDKAVRGTESGETDGGVGSRIIGELLKEMEDNKGHGTKWMATCNDLGPILNTSQGALTRRFTAFLFVDMPTPDEAKGIAKIWSGKKNVEIPEDYDFTNYTGADIEKLASMMKMKKCSAEEASQYVIPYGKSHADELEEIRRKAEGVCIWAGKREKQGVVGATVRKVRKKHGKTK